MRALVSVSLFVSALAGCSGGGAPSGPPPARSDLAEGVVARVGTEVVTANGVARIASAQGIDVASARDLAIRDALLANEARSSGVADRPDVQKRIDAVLARRLLRQLLQEADRMGPTTDGELTEVMKRRWLELDRPEGFRTVHAVVRFAEGADAATKGRAEAVAQAIAQALAPVAESARKTPSPPPEQLASGVKDPIVAAFRGAVDGVSRDGFEVVVEDLPPVTPDGRVLVMNGGAVEESFAKAASLLAQRGDTSPLVATTYGVHVLLLLERTPASIVPAEERRKLVRDEVLWSRAAALRSRLLEGLRRDVLVEGGADALLALVPIER